VPNQARPYPIFSSRMRREPGTPRISAHPEALREHPPAGVECLRQQLRGRRVTLRKLLMTGPHGSYRLFARLSNKEPPGSRHGSVHPLVRSSARPLDARERFGVRRSSSDQPRHAHDRRLPYTTLHEELTQTTA
jgi:hypothetical protein